MLIDELIPDDAERRILQLQQELAQVRAERHQAMALTAVWAYAAGQLYGLLRDAAPDVAALRGLALVQQASAPDAAQHLLAVADAAERLVAAAPALPDGTLFLSSAWQEFVQAVQRRRKEGDTL